MSNAKNSDDKSATWDIINEVLGRKENSRVYPDKVQSLDQTDSSGPKLIANALNEHFATVAKKLE